MTTTPVPETSERPTLVAVQDCLRLFREAIAWLLSTEPGFEVVAVTATADEMAGLIGANPVDIVLVELDCDVCDPYRLAARAMKRHPHVAIVGISAVGELQPSDRARQAGVRVVVPRDAATATLLQTLRSVTDARRRRRPRVVDLRESPPLLAPGSPAG